MKKLLATCLPALALLSLGSCASTSHLTTTEDDGVYYSSKDRTTLNATASVGQSGPAAPADQGADEATNPEYRSGGNGSGGSSAGSGSSSEYYADDYSYAARIRRFHQPLYRGFSYGYYDVVYADPFWYGGYSPFGWGPGYYGSYYDPFFYSPYAYGGSLVTINIGFGRPYYNSWGCFGCYGYGYGYGGYGYGGFRGYGSSYYDGFYNGYYSGLRSSNGGRGTATHYGPRRDGAREANSSGITAGGANGGRGRGRIDGGTASPTGGVSNGGGLSNGGSSEPTVVPGRGRGRIVEGTAGSGVSTADTPIRQPLNGGTNPGRELTDRQIKEQEGRVGQMSGAADQPRLDTNPSRGRWRSMDNGAGNGGNSGAETAPSTPRDYSQPQRGRWRSMDNGSGNGSNSGGEAAPSTPRDYSQPQRARYRETQPVETPRYQGGTEQPREQPRERPARQRIFESQPSEQPTRQREYSEPSRSYSPPTNFGGGGRSSGGGGNSGGGGGRGRGRMD